MFSGSPFQEQKIIFPLFITGQSPAPGVGLQKYLLNEALLPFMIAITCADTGAVALLVISHITTE